MKTNKFEHLSPNQARMMLQLIRPHLVELMGLLPLLQTSVDNDPCSGLDCDGECRECLIEKISAYGITSLDGIIFLQNNQHLRQLLNALETVGQQILNCLSKCMGDNAPQSTSAAFQEVFPETRLFNDTNEENPLRDKAQAGFEGDYATITFPRATDFYVCELEEEDADYPDIEGAECPDGEKAVYAYANPYTVEGIVRHEIGHIFWRILELVTPDSLILENLEDRAFRVSDEQRKVFNAYFPNYNLYEPNSDRAKTELFADAFSVMGRFDGEGNFLRVLPSQPTPVRHDVTRQEAITEANLVFASDSRATVKTATLGRLEDYATPVWIVTIEFQRGAQTVSEVMLIDGIKKNRQIIRRYVPTVSETIPEYVSDDQIPEFPSDEEILLGFGHVQYFQNNFCCWVAQILGLSPGDVLYDCLCSSSN